MEKYRKSILKNEIAFIIGRLISFISVIWLIDLYHRDELFIEFLKYETLPLIFSSLLFWRKINLNNLIVKVTMAAITLYNLFEFNFYSLLAQYILSETIVQALMYNNGRSKNIRIGLIALNMNMCFIISAQVLNLQFTYFFILFVLTSTSMAFLFMFIVKENDYSNSGRALRSIFRQIYVFGFRSAFLNATMPVIYIYLLKFVNLLIVYAMSFSRSKDSSILSLHISNLQIYSTLALMYTISVSIAFWDTKYLLSFLTFIACIIVSLYMENASETPRI